MNNPTAISAASAHLKTIELLYFVFFHPLVSQYGSEILLHDSSPDKIKHVLCFFRANFQIHSGLPDLRPSDTFPAYYDLHTRSRTENSSAPPLRRQTSFLHICNSAPFPLSILILYRSRPEKGNRQKTISVYNYRPTDGFIDF